MKSLLALTLLVLTLSCGSSKGNGSNGDTQTINKMISAARIQDLENKKNPGAGDKAELKALENGASTQDAKLAASLAVTLYQKGLPDQEASLLKYLEQGKSKREAELLAQKDNGSLNESEKEELRKLSFPDKDPGLRKSEASPPPAKHGTSSEINLD